MCLCVFGCICMELLIMCEIVWCETFVNAVILVIIVACWCCSMFMWDIVRVLMVLGFFDWLGLLVFIRW